MLDQRFILVVLLPVIFLLNLDIPLLDELFGVEQLLGPYFFAVVLEVLLLGELLADLV